MQIVRKLLTKPIWMWERFWAQQALTSPTIRPISINVARPTIVIQTTPKTFNQALWCAASLMIHTRKSFGLTFVLDARTWPQELSAQAKKLFPGVSLRTTYELLKEIPTDAPCLIAYAQAHPLGRKLTTIMVTSKDQPIIFSDDDVLAFAPLEEIVAWGANPMQALILTEEKTGSDPLVHKRAQIMNLKAPAHFNSGLIALPAGFLSIDVAEKLLERIPTASLTWFAETALLAHQLSEATPLPSSEYVVNCQRQFYFEPDVDYGKIKLRHFVGPVRHLLALRGIPAFKNSCNWMSS